MREELDPTVREAVLDAESELKRRRRGERYRRRSDCLALAVKLCASAKPSTQGGEAVLEIADLFERWLMKPFQEQDDE